LPVPHRTAFVAVAFALALAACGAAAPSATPEPSTHVVAGTLTFTEPNPPSCDGQGGYADIRAGADLLVVDGGGATIGKGTLSQGTGIRGGGCVFSFLAEGVPEAPFYSVRIGDRDGPTWTLEEMEALGWSVSLTIGT
jgi:hypothetical protein